MLNSGSIAEYEHGRLLYRVTDSMSEGLDLSYYHKVAAGLVQADLEAIIMNHIDCELDRVDICGMTPLHWAAYRANIPALQTFLRARSSISIKAKDHRGRTALHLAIISGNQRCVELLLMAGSDILAKDKRGHQALHTASVYVDDREILNILLMAGADLYSLTNDGCSAFQLACIYNKSDNAASLLASGARVDDQDNIGDTTFLCAVHRGSAPIVELLIRHGARIEHYNSFNQTIITLIGTLRHSRYDFSLHDCSIWRLGYRETR